MTFSTEDLISAVLARPPLWNSSDPNHSNRQVIKVLWEEIKESCGIFDVELIKRKWKNIKDQYRKELKKIPETRSGDSANNFQYQWKHFNQMSFMRDQIQPSRSESNITTNFTSDSDDNEDTQKSFRDEPNSTDVASPLSTEIYSPISNSPSPAPSNSSQGRKRKSANDLRAEFLEIEKNKLLMYGAKQKARDTQEFQKTEDYYYLMSLLPQMEKFSAIQKFRVRNKINSIMMTELQQGTFQDIENTHYGYNTSQDNYCNY